ncbi:M20/M25/M40 family metallo-hydrolase [Candidatus Leptofilum sp.]|uniref:M20/M25/M40 family metallo-hydrolase n=1 Tax=Candidatus Leptofilum sp. TaxID=3241576 RepID=UPI003B5B3B04
MTNLNSTLQLFSDLLVAAPSGREAALAAVVRQKLTGWGIAHEQDGMGNVIVRLDGHSPQAPLIMVAAHMDEIGMVVTKINLDGSLQVSNSGGLHPWKLGEGPVEILGDVETIIGVLSMGSTHTANAAKTAVTWNDVRVLTGLSADQLKVAGVRPGSTGVPTRERRGPVLFGDPADPLVAAWTFDDRMGVVALLRLLERMKVEGIRPYHPTIIAFTVSEEVGGHGAKSLALREQPEIFVSVDGAPMPPESDLVLDGRPAIWSKDRLAHYDQPLLQAFCQAVLDAGTELQPVVYQSAASDASLVYYAGGAQRIACMGQVRANSHGYEVARLSVFDNMLNTLVQFVKDFEG